MSGSLVFKVHLSSVLVKHHILQDAAKPDGFPDLRLLVLFEADALGIAATLDVEHSPV